MTTIERFHPITTLDFLAAHPVFRLDEAREILDGDVRQRISHAVETGRAIRLRRELFASVPAGASPETFQVNPYQIASKLRVNGVLAGHSAIELLGMAHSLWNRKYIYADSGPGVLIVQNSNYVVTNHPGPLDASSRTLGIQSNEIQGMVIRHLGPERCLIDGFSRPRLSGGITELVLSLDGLQLLNFDLLEEVLRGYNQKTIYGAVGWFLERHQDRLFVPDRLLAWLESRKPAAPHYLERSAGRSQLSARWNVMVPLEFVRTGEFEGA